MAGRGVLPRGALVGLAVGAALALAACGDDPDRASATFTPLGATRTLEVQTRGSVAIVVGTLELGRTKDPRTLSMNTNLGWEPFNVNQDVEFCVLGGAQGREMLAEQRRAPDRTFASPDLSADDVATSCVYDSAKRPVPAGTYTVVLRVDAPHDPTRTSIYATTLRWSGLGYSDAKLTTATLRRPDHRDFAKVVVTRKGR